MDPRKEEGSLPKLEELDAGWGGPESEPKQEPNAEPRASAAADVPDDLDAGWDDGEDEPDEPPEPEPPGLSREERAARAAANKERARVKAAAKKERRKARAEAALSKQKTKQKKTGKRPVASPDGPGEAEREEEQRPLAAQGGSKAVPAAKRRELTPRIAIALVAAVVVGAVLVLLLTR